MFSRHHVVVVVVVAPSHPQCPHRPGPSNSVYPISRQSFSPLLLLEATVLNHAENLLMEELWRRVSLSASVFYGLLCRTSDKLVLTLTSGRAQLSRVRLLRRITRCNVASLTTTEHYSHLTTRFFEIEPRATNLTILPTVRVDHCLCQV
jgi:hypothetical protein